MSKFFYKHEDEVTDEDLNFLGEDVEEEQEVPAKKKKIAEAVKEEPPKKTKVVKKVRRVATEEPKEHITIRIPTPNGRMIERIIYWIIILVLFFMVFGNPLSSFMSGEAVEEPATTSEGAENPPEEVASGEEVAENEESENSEGESSPEKEEEPEEEESTSSGSSTTTASGDPYITIKDINTEEGDNDHMKVTSIEVVITNGGSDFIPMVKVYAYDDNDKEYMEEFERGTWQFDLGLKPGEKKMATVAVKPSTFYDLDLDKTFTVELYEVGDDDKIDEDVEKFDLEDYD